MRKHKTRTKRARNGSRSRGGGSGRDSAGGRGLKHGAAGGLPARLPRVQSLRSGRRAPGQPCSAPSWRMLAGLGAPRQSGPGSAAGPGFSRQRRLEGQASRCSRERASSAHRGLSPALPGWNPGWRPLQKRWGRESEGTPHWCLHCPRGAGPSLCGRELHVPLKGTLQLTHGDPGPASRLRVHAPSWHPSLGAPKPSPPRPGPAPLWVGRWAGALGPAPQQACPRRETMGLTRHPRTLPPSPSPHSLTPRGVRVLVRSGTQAGPHGAGQQGQSQTGVRLRSTHCPWDPCLLAEPGAGSKEEMGAGVRGRGAALGPWRCRAQVGPPGQASVSLSYLVTLPMLSLRQVPPEEKSRDPRPGTVMVITASETLGADRRPGDEPGAGA